MTRRRLGVCYFPEHWDPADWPRDAAMMRDLGIDFARIGEFAWGVIEPEPGRLNLDWMQESLDLLHAHGIEVVLCTPTATPRNGLSTACRTCSPPVVTDRSAPSARAGITAFASGLPARMRPHHRAVAGRFGTHPAVIGWQTDNEFGCHDTTVLRQGRPCRLPRLAGTALPVDRRAEPGLGPGFGRCNMAVSTISNCRMAGDRGQSGALDGLPALCLAMVAEFNELQADILRELSPGRDIIHNFMGRIVGFDHYAVGAQLDVSSWDSYPLGFLDQMRDLFPADHRRAFARAGGWISRPFTTISTAPPRRAAGG